MDKDTLKLVMDGQSAAGQDDWEEAWTLWDRAVQRANEPAIVRGLIALVLAGLGKMADANQQIAIIRESDPKTAAHYAAEMGLELWEKFQKPKEALAAMGLALAISGEANDIQQLAYVSGNLGNLCSALNALEAALLHYGNARQYYQQVGDTEWESMMLSSGGGVLKDLQRFEEAEQWLKEAAEQAAKEPHPEAQILAWLNMGSLYGSQQRYSLSKKMHQLALNQALHLGHGDYIRKATQNLALDLRHLQLSGMEEVQPVIDIAMDAFQNKEYDLAIFILHYATLLVDPKMEPIGQADLFHALAQIEYAVNKMEAAIAHLNKAAELALAANNEERYSTYIVDLSAKFLQQGKLQEAAASSDDAIAAAGRSGAYEPLAAGLGNRGLIALYREQLSIAQRLFTRQWEIAKEHEIPSQRANAANSLGSVYQRMGAIEVAEKWFHTAIRESEDFKWRGGLPSLINIGHIERRRGDAKKAIESYRKAQELAVERDSADIHFDALVNLGIVYTEEEQLSKAEEAFAQATKINDYLGDTRKQAQLDIHTAYLLKKTGQLDEALKKFQNAYHDFTDLNWQNATRCALEAAIILLERGQYEEALQVLLPSRHHFEQRIQRLSDHQAWSMHREEERYVEVLMELVLKMDDPITALLVAEGSRGRAFRLALRRKESGHRTSFFAGQQAIRRATLESLTSGKVKGLKKEHIAPFFKALSGAKDPLEQALSKEQIHEFSAKLKTTFVLYTRGYPDHWYAWVADPEDIRLFHLDLTPIGGTEGLRKKIRTLQKGLGISERGIRLSQTAERLDPGRHLEELYHLLIAPFEAALPREEGARICFIPTGPLFELPFSALMDTEGRYLLDRYATYISPSLYFFFSQKESRGEGSLIVGDPIPGENKLFGTLPPLPFAIEEARAIASQYQTTALIGAEASRERVLELLPKVRVAHFAAHGCFNEGNPLYSAIALSKTAEDEGFLYGIDLKSLDLNSQLVVMSTCSSSLGMITGDGVLGLCREFMTAGADSILASLWAVADRSSAFHMTHLHAVLEEKPVVEALRSAQLRTKESFDDVSHWAPYVLWGWPE